MQLWTHHPTGFQVDSADLVIDPTKGQYWCSRKTGFRYQDVLPRIQELVGTKQFLWCYTVRGLYKRWTEEMDIVEWELNVPESQILQFIRSYVWESILWNKKTDWGNLFVIGKPEPGEDIHALVKVPLLAEWVKHHGQLPPVNP